MSLFCQSLSEFWPPAPGFTEKNLSSLAGKVYLVTGSTGGIGLQLVRILYSLNATVYLTSRTAATAEHKITEIKGDYPNSTGKLDYLVLNLSDLSTIRPAAEAFLAKEKYLNVVWYNAGIMTSLPGRVTAQGYEIQWGTNVVGHFLLDRLLFPALLAAVKVSEPGSVRTIWVSSDAHHYFSPGADGIDWDDISTKRETGFKSKLSLQNYYGQSKAGNVLVSHQTAALYGKEGIVSVALNPGHLRTDLNRDLSKFAILLTKLICFSSIYGAYTELYAGLSEDFGLENNGKYVLPWGRKGLVNPSVWEGIEKRGTGRRLWEYLEGEVKEYLL